MRDIRNIIFRKQLKECLDNKGKKVKGLHYIRIVGENRFSARGIKYCTWAVQGTKNISSSGHIQFNYTKEDFFKKTRRVIFIEYYVLKLLWYIGDVKAKYIRTFGYNGNILCKVLNFLHIFFHPKKYEYY